MKKYIDAEALKLKFAVESAEASARDPNNKVFVAMCKAINDVAEKTIDEMSAAFVQEVVHGKWISKGHWCVACSYCGKMFQDYDCTISCGNYCPHCGAKMDGDGE